MSTEPRRRVLICHERFLFRYGADRVFILIGRRLKALGWHVSMLAAHFDRDVLANFADEIHTLPLPNAYERADEFASRWLERQFATTAEARLGYDLIIHGGWPLFAATPALRRLSPVVFFLDHGVVPSDGYPEAKQRIFALLHQLRRKHLAECTHAAGVSDFIIRTQTQPDTEGRIPVRVIYNGTDHLAAPPEEPDPAGLGPQYALVRKLAKTHPLILNLGRFETGTYKNSQTALDVYHLVRSARPDARLLVLESAENLRLHPELLRGVVPLGYPDDPTLCAILRHIAAGLSVSLWEGFNLPLVELLRARVPAFALTAGAHPEVVPDPWFLADTPIALAARITHALGTPDAAAGRLRSAQAEAHWAYLTWPRFVDEMLAFLGLSAVSPAAVQ